MSLFLLFLCVCMCEGKSVKLEVNELTSWSRLGGFLSKASYFPHFNKHASVFALPLYVCTFLCKYFE